MARNVLEHHKWFEQARYGLFIHWGPYSLWGRGEQVMFREHMPPDEYIARAKEWNPLLFDARRWASIARQGGFRYACLTARHHDGYCLWDTATTSYSAAKQAPRRDFVREYCEAFREAGLKVGLYYSWLDWRIPAFFEPEADPDGLERVLTYIQAQLDELMSNYGQIDYLFFDGEWPLTAEQLGSAAIVERIRQQQPGIIINNRLGMGGSGAGDFGTPEHHIKAEDRLWESCQTSYWRLWGYTSGERWKTAPEMLDLLCQCAEQGGNLLMNVGPDALGRIPPEFCERSASIGRWLETNGPCIFGTGSGDATEFVGYGRQTVRGNDLYLIFRFWPDDGAVYLRDLESTALKAELLGSNTEIEIVPLHEGGVKLTGLPAVNPSELFPVIRLHCDGVPRGGQWARQRLWNGDPSRVARWAEQSRFDPYA